MAATKPRSGAATAPLKVDAETDELITDGAHFLGLTKKGLVDKAVRAYLESRRAEIRQAMLEKLRRLDGSATSSVSLLTGVPAEEIERLGGIGEDI